MPYQFPYTNFHDLDLDWMLQQIKAMGAQVDEFKESLETSDTNNVGSFTTIFNRLQDYTTVLNAYMKFYNDSDPDHPIFIPTYTTIPYNDHEYRLMTGVTINPDGFNLGDFTEQKINSLVAEIQRQVVENAVLFVPQTLTGEQKIQALENIGLSAPSVETKNMFDLDNCWWVESVAQSESRPAGFTTLFSGISGVGTVDLTAHSLIPSAHNQLRLQAANRSLISKYYATGQGNPPARYLAPGTYTLSLKITCIDPENYPIPDCVVMSGALKCANAGAVNGYIDYTDSTTNPSRAYWVYGTANRGEVGANNHVYADGQSAYFRKTFTVPAGVDCLGCCAVQFGRIGATQAPAQMYMFSEIQLEKGENVTSYADFGTEFTFSAYSTVDAEAIERLTDEVDTLKQNVWHDRYELPDIVANHIRNRTNSSVGDSLIFFTDAHPANDARWNQQVYQDMGIIAKAKRSFPNDLVVNGGDWLLSQESDAALVKDQISKMCYVYGVGREMLGDDVVYLMGNHDANNNAGGSASPTVPVGGFDLLFPGRTYYVLDKPNSVIKYAIWNTWTTGNSVNDQWITAQIAYFAAYLRDHPNQEYIFLSHIFIQNTDYIQHTETMPDAPTIYTPAVSAQADHTPFNTIALEAAKIAKAYNTQGEYSFNNVTYSYATNTGKVRYILAGHVHKEMYMIYDTIPVFMAGSFGLGAADTSSPRDLESYVNVLNTLEGGDSQHLFHVINPVQYTVPSTSDNAVDRDKTIQEQDVILTWTSGTASFSLV